MAHGAAMVRRVLVGGIPRDRLVNINFPACTPDEVTGVEITSQGKRRQEFAQIEGRHDGRGNPYFWIIYGGGDVEADEGTDVHALGLRRISITPLKFDLTDEQYRERLAAAFAAAPL
jgi:5'-nucleotidase